MALAVVPLVAVLFLATSGGPVAALAGEAQGPAELLSNFLSILAPPEPSAPPPRHAALQPGKTSRSNPLYPYVGNAPVEQEEPASAYRTVCVRLCDGYYWPVSDAAPMSRFQHDRTSCETSCEQPAKLFYQPVGDTNAGHLVGLDGSSYRSLPRAYSYRSALNPACRCKPEPWSESEVERHQQYARERRDNETEGLDGPFGAAARANAAAADADPVPDTDVQAGNPAAEALAASPTEEREGATNAETLPGVGASEDPSRRPQQPVDGAGHLDVPLR